MQKLLSKFGINKIDTLAKNLKRWMKLLAGLVLR